MNTQTTTKTGEGNAPRVNDAKTDALLVVISSCRRAAEYLRKTHDYNAWIPLDRICEGCDVILSLENAISKSKHALYEKKV